MATKSIFPAKRELHPVVLEDHGSFTFPSTKEAFLGSPGVLLAYAHCPTWRWMIWATTTRLVVVDTQRASVWVGTLNPYGEDVAVAISQVGEWAMLWRRSGQTWEEAMNQNSSIVQESDSIRFVPPAEMWSGAYYFGSTMKDRGGHNVPGGDLGSAILWKIRVRQTWEEQKSEVRLARGASLGRMDIGCVAISAQAGILSNHPTLGSSLSVGSSHHIYKVSSPFGGDTSPLRLDKFSWTRLGGSVQNHCGWWAKLEHSSMPTGRYNFYSMSAGPRPFDVGGMEDSQGAMWFLTGGVSVSTLVRQSCRDPTFL